MTSFVGRRRDVAEVRRLLSSARLVTLTGVGGSGKSRLAVRVATELRRAFPDGVWLVDLAAVTEPDLVEYAVAETLGLDVQTEQPMSEVDYLRDRDLLLVLDNCEHLVDACAGFADRALRASPSLRLLCTSRQALGIVAEHVWDVAPLDIPEPGRPLPPDAEARYPGLTLFLERAAAVQPGFRLDPTNGPVVVKICHRLDGLPLAIELAAAQLRTLSLNQLDTGLREHFRLLETRHAVPTRHRRLETAFDWSFALCSPGEQALWLRLSVFAGGFTLAATEYVVDGPAEDLLDQLTGLLDKSVLRREETPDGPRYRLLETVRRYGLDRLRDQDPADEPRLRDRHRDWYLSVAERFHADWFGPRQLEWAARIRTEYTNLRAALEYCFGDSGDVTVGLRLAAALGYYWFGCGLQHEGRYWLDRALAAAPEPSPPRLHALNMANWTVPGLGATTTTEERVAEHAELAQRLGDPVAEAEAETVRAMLLFAQGEVRAARLLLEPVVTRLRELAVTGLARFRAENSLALALSFDGDQLGAAELVAEARDRCAATGDRWYLSYLLITSIYPAWSLGRIPEAVGYLHESILIRRALGDVLGIAVGIERLAWLAAAAGDHERAARLLGVAEQRWHDAGLTFSVPQWVQGHEECVARSRAALGEERYDALVAQGGQLTEDEAIRYALDEAEPPRTEPAVPEPDDFAAVLTPRERQVARLIAEGLSNHQIASRLVTSQRTAESHVQNILRKLGFASRAQVAAWVARQPVP
jgi:non-specific serine/threonine protein kinase